MANSLRDELHKPHPTAHHKWSDDVLRGTHAVNAVEAHLRLFTNHEYAAAALATKFTDTLVERMQTQERTLKTLTKELRLSSMDAEDASDVARKLYTDCTAHFANIAMMLDALVMNDRRRQEEENRAQMYLQQQQQLLQQLHQGSSHSVQHSPSARAFQQPSPMSSPSAKSKSGPVEIPLTPLRPATPSAAPSPATPLRSPSAAASGPSPGRPVPGPGNLFYMPHR